MPASYKEEEELILDAVEEAQAIVASGEIKLNLSALARKYKVDAQRLARRYAGGESKSTRAPTNRKLTELQEKALLEYIAILDRLEISARMSLIQASADQLLRDAHQDSNTTPPVVGKNWVKNFMKRHPQVHRVKQKPREISRMTQDRENLSWWFKKLENVVKKQGILPDDIWNVDEIGFRIGIGKSQWIITLCPSREAHLASETNRETLTCIEAVSAVGAHISPMVIISANQHTEGWIKNDLPGDTLLAVSENGYTDDILALKWIKHFDERTKGMTKGSKRLLIFDGHGSHCTKQFLEHCDANKIVPFSLPPHSSHILQPLDVSVFQPYKHWHKEAIDAATRTGCTNFNRVEFLSALASIRKQTMKTNTIKTGFRRTGIHPFNPEIVLSTFAAPEDFAPAAEGFVPSTPAQSSSPPATPQTIRTLSRSAHKIQERYDLSPTMAKYIRGSLQQVQTGNLAVEALEKQTAAQQERNKKMKGLERWYSLAGFCMRRRRGK
ncbi:hypothetical protein CF319_g9184 [Tilletia indica]|nr:hypothetical protein CF319_g9184 [Tilletia indica]